MKVIGIETAGTGYNNQLRGLILESSQIFEKSKVPVTRNSLLKGKENCLLHRNNFPDDDSFKEAIDETISSFYKKALLNKTSMPEFIIIPFDHSLGEKEGQNVDLLSNFVKESFKKRDVNVRTLVIGSKLYDYQFVDLINIGEHQLSAEDIQYLKENPRLNKKIITTLGVPSNLNWKTVNIAAGLPKVKEEIQKIKNKNKKVILFSLGGKSAGNAIQFTIKDAQKLVDYAQIFKKINYEVIFTNCHRTPNDVTDFLYEKSKTLNFSFYNAKKIVSSEEAEKNFRLYHGKYNEEFKQQSEESGENIYPGILSVCSVIVNTYDSFSYTSDSAVLGIPSLVYDENEIDIKRRPDCNNLFQICKKRGYILCLSDIIKELNKNKKIKIQTKKMESVNKQIISMIKKDFLKNFFFKKFFFKKKFFKRKMKQ